jgi:hypothetical protein
MASDTSSWFGGCCCVPNAVLRNENTTTSRTKLVITNIKEGANTSRVSITKRFRLFTRSCGVSGAFSEIFTDGICVDSAEKSNIDVDIIKPKALIQAIVSKQN